MRKEFVINTDHFQLLIGDRIQGPAVDTSELWSSEQQIATLPDGSSIVGLGTARFGGRTRLELCVEPCLPDPHEPWIPIGDFTLKIPSGELLLWAPESADLDQMPVMQLEPGEYRGSAYSMGTNEVVDEMAIDGPDRYCVSLRKKN